ncbi:hypothetical protein N9N67_07555 [Bacteriovoracaceae bacterium]|nr:hypothetical protein [Bacteriovoracaceae bacterium]
MQSLSKTKFVLIISGLVFFSSCAEGKKKKSSSKKKNDLANSVAPVKKAKLLHKDPCSEAGRCISIEEIPYSTVNDKIKITDQISDEQKQSNSALTLGDRITYSKLYLVNSGNEDSEVDSKKTSDNCYVIRSEEQEYLETRINIAVPMGKEELNPEDFSDFDLFTVNNKDYRLLNETPKCQKLFSEHKIMANVGSWNSFDLNTKTDDIQSSVELAENLSDEIVKVEISEKLFKLTLDGKLAYRIEIIRKNTSRKENKLVGTNKVIHMISPELPTSVPVIYGKEESFDKNNKLYEYTSQLLVSIKAGTPSGKVYPSDLIVEGSN